MAKKKKSITIKFNIKLKLFLILTTIIILILLGLIIVSFQQEPPMLEQYQSDYISFVYDNNFVIVSEEEYIELNNKDKSAAIVIKKLDYTSNAQNKGQSEIAASLSYQVIENEKDYINTYTEKEETNQQNIYYYLYENYEKERQIESITIFDNDYIYIIIYSADSSEFDLYAESIALIVESIEV